MTHVFRIEDSNPYAKSIVAFLKTLDFVQEEKVEKAVKFPTMTEEEIIEQALRAEEEIKQGKTISHDQAYQQFKKWK
jgi:cell division protein FtsX